MTDGDWGDVFVVDVSQVTSEGDGDEDTSLCLPNASPKAHVTSNGVWSTACSSLVPEGVVG